MALHIRHFSPEPYPNPFHYMSTNYFVSLGRGWEETLKILNFEWYIKILDTRVFQGSSVSNSHVPLCAFYTGGFVTTLA